MIDCLRPAIMGDGVTAQPLEERHREELRQACGEDSDIWTIYASNYGPDAFDETFDRLLSSDYIPFALFASDERMIGMSSFMNIVTDRQTLEIGNTYYRPEFRGSGINRPIKDMMMRRAFDCGFVRIEFRVDARNARSQAALAKIGAVREGVMRHDRTTWTGHRRDTVLFSVLSAERGN